MNSLNDECTSLKKDYDNCFNKWFREGYLKGDTNNVCGEVFEKYQTCIKNVLQVEGIDISEVKKSVLGTSDEKQSPLL